MNEFACPKCGEITELVTTNEANRTCDCTCGKCESTWRTDETGKVLSDTERCSSSQPLRNGQKFSIAVLASMPTRQVLNQITEDWGALGDKIDPELLDFSGAYSHKPRTPGQLGQNAEVGKFTFKSAAQLYRNMTDGYAVGYPVVGMIFSIDGHQKIAIWRQDDGTFLVKVVGKAVKIGAGSGMWNGMRLQPRELYTMLNKLNKEYTGILTAEVVEPDKEREKTKTGRVGAKSGSPFYTKSGYAGDTEMNSVHPSSEGFKKLARQELLARLEQFKAGRAQGVETPEQLLDFVKQKGYLDKIKLRGVVYELRYARLDVKDIEATSAGKRVAAISPMVTVDYVYSDSNGKSFRAQANSDELPRSFSVGFKLEGGSIVPTEIVTTDSEDKKRVYSGSIPAEAGEQKEESVTAICSKLVRNLLEQIAKK